MIPRRWFLAAVVLMAGCSSSKNVILADSLDATPQVDGAVVNSSLLEKGGSVLLGSFKAGPGTAADRESDRLSAMMIKGIKDALPAGGRLTVSSRADADFYIDGFIEDYGRDPHFTHRKLRRDQIHLSVDGNVWFRDTGEKVMSFQTSVVIDLKHQDPQAVADQVGSAIGRLIASKEAGT